MIHRITLVLSVLAFSVVGLVHAEPPLPLVPLPVRASPGNGKFKLDAATTIVAADAREKGAAEMLASWLRPPTGLPLAIKESAGGKCIRFSIDASLAAKLGREGYLLKCGSEGVTIRAADGAGLIYGAQTFRQLLPPQAFRNTKADGVSWTAAAAEIQDHPRFVWRGFSMDVSRHFFPIEYLHRLVDDMSAQKLNLLQLHLTDDDGWRVEIKKYPKLTEIGAWRGTGCVLPNTRKGETHARYGGFYSQEQLKKLVAYAKARNVEIMPEIDLPGHALAIVTAYPETLPSKLSDAVSAQGHSANAISPAKENNYRMIDDIIAEVAAIFPFPFIHIGGDEVNHKVWEACPEIKAMMEKEKLGNLHQVQVRFTKRLEEILTKRGRKMIGWQEIADNKLSPETGIMAWIGPEPGWNAAKRGAPAVMAPGGHCYFDMGNPGGEDEPPAHWWAGLVGLGRAYEFDPLSPKAGLDETARSKVLGFHAALWTEFVTGWKSKSGWLELKDESECAEYKIWPRLCATAETAWTPQELREFENFSQRMGGQYARMAEAGRKFRLEPPTAKLEKGAIQIQPAWPGAKVRYTVDGSDPFNSPSGKIWDGKPIDGRHRAGLAMRSIMPENKILSPLTRGATIAPAGTWDVAGWQRDQTKTLVYQVKDRIDQPGRWRVRMEKTKGPDGLVVEKVELRAGSDILAAAGPAKRGSVILDLKEPVSGNPELVIIARFTGEKPEAKGNVVIEKLAGATIPGLRIETKIPAYGDDHNTDQLLDSDPETFFWSSRNLASGDSLTWALPEAAALKTIELQTGMPNGTKDQILDAVLEVSENGTDFTKASGFQYGAAKADLGGKMIKAIRIRATADSPGWVILQDLNLTR
jgi:hexosaminidase